MLWIDLFNIKLVRRFLLFVRLVKENFEVFAWLLSLGVAVAAIIAWGQGLNWHFSILSIYKIFPIFGLLAFSLMWSMYIVGFTSRRLKIKAGGLRGYYRVLGFLVVLALVLHPGLLSWQLWRDGFGLPPNSYLRHYVAPGLEWVAALGTISLLMFLVYEFRHKYRSRGWWKYFEYGVDGAMLAIFYHALRLGRQISAGWFRYVWFFYGAALMIVLYDKYWPKIVSERYAKDKQKNL